MHKFQLGDSYACRFCGTEIPNTPNKPGRIKHFCSINCRQAAYRRRKSADKKQIGQQIDLFAPQNQVNDAGKGKQENR